MARLTLPKRYKQSYGTLFKDFSGGQSDIDSESGTYTLPSVAGDYAATPNLSASGSVHIDVNESGADNNYRMNFDTTGHDFTQIKWIDIWFYDVTPTQAFSVNSTDTKLTVRLGTDALGVLTNYYNFAFTTSARTTAKQYAPNTWKIARVPVIIGTNGIGFVSTGAPAGDFSDVTFLQVEWRGASTSTDMEVYMDSIYFDTKARPKLIWAFDDANDTDLTEAYDYMYTTNGLVGTSYIISGSIGNTNILSAADCATMYANGWDIANHSIDGTNLNTLSTADALTNVETCRDWINDNIGSRASDHIAYPSGGSTDAQRAAFAAAGFKTGRNTTYISNYPSPAIGHPDVPAQAGYAEFQFQPVRCDETTYASGAGSGADIKTAINNAITYDGVVVLMTHKIVADQPGATGTEMNQTSFRAMVDYVKDLSDKGLIDVVTISEYYSGNTSPRLTTASRQFA